MTRQTAPGTACGARFGGWKNAEPAWPRFVAEVTAFLDVAPVPSSTR